MRNIGVCIVLTSLKSEFKQERVVVLHTVKYTSQLNHYLSLQSTVENINNLGKGLTVTNLGRKSANVGLGIIHLSLIVTPMLICCQIK